MARKLTAPKRKKMNFMIDIDLAAQLEESCPAGERSDLVNQAIAETMRIRNARKAIVYIESMQKKYDLRVKNGAILKAIHDARRE